MPETLTTTTETFAPGKEPNVKQRDDTAARARVAAYPSSKLRPLGNRIVVMPDVEIKLIKGAAAEAIDTMLPPVKGTVISTGSGISSVKPGDKVFYRKYSGVYLEFEGKFVKVLEDDKDILATVAE